MTAKELGVIEEGLAALMQLLSDKGISSSSARVTIQNDQTSFDVKLSSRGHLTCQEQRHGAKGDA